MTGVQTCALPICKLMIARPKSISFDRLSHTAACKLFDDMAEVAYAESGLDMTKVLEETERAA